ncbi:tyrosine-type recombinase/integrase [Bifidobacterium felsineum]|uniref:tyrosine-type recombinase/integrase n=1 Tax=Bifidobacterium felsineum TaxID=2045440 RepID=UPI003B84685A
MRDHDPTQGEKPTIGEWCDHWVEHMIRGRRTPDTYRTYRTRIDHAITPAIGGIRIDLIRPSHLDRLDRYEKDKSAATRTLTLTVLRQALRAARAEGLIDRNPAETTDPPQGETIRRDALTPGQAKDVIRLEPDPQLRLLWRLLFTTGMRIGETAGLTPNEIRHVDGTTVIMVVQQARRLPHTTGEDMPDGYQTGDWGDGWKLTRTKTRKGMRAIPLPDRLARDLETHIREHGIAPDRPVFTTRRGNPMGRENARQQWRRALGRAGLPPLPLHTTRHTMATMLARNHVPDTLRKALIGHARIDTTDDIYTHLDAGTVKPAIQTIDRLLEDDDTGLEKEKE